MQINTNSDDILDAVYKKPLPNRYLASFTIFLAENRGHYMIENIIEDGFNDFFFNHVYKYRESWTLPINFIGSVAYGFKDVLKDMCNSYELQLGKVIKKPMDGLVKFHQLNKDEDVMAFKKITESTSHYRHLEKMTVHGIIDQYQ